jgi:hypothetical protein
VTRTHQNGGRKIIIPDLPFLSREKFICDKNIYLLWEMVISK